VGYATKSKRGGMPKMVLIGDIVGDDEDRVAGRQRGGAHGQCPRARASSPSARGAQEVLADRKRTAAISRHTNAFKVNEDVVIPLPRMGEYTDGIERINIELSLRNKLALTERWRPSSPRASCRWPRPTTPASTPAPSCWTSACPRRWR
jgi:FAD/FMN-containing dehydrogenase